MDLSGKLDINYEETSSLSGNNVVVAYIMKDDQPIVLGKYYKNTGLCWNIVDPVRESFPLIEQWKQKMIKDIERNGGV
jgi:hypothetical protein